MKSILDELKTECPFSDIFEDKELVDGHIVFKKKIMHIRADFDGYRWQNTIWPYNNRTCPESVNATEIDEVYSRLVGSDGFETLKDMTEFCYQHPEAKVNEHSDQEYNFYLVGKTCNFWIRLITRRGDYNIYLHAFEKGEH